jgi:tetratricopeptide (TPR) repeat protein
MGFVLELLGLWDDALVALRRATDLDPKLDRAWYGQGLVLIRLQRFDEAVAALKRNTELQPMSPYGWYQLARIHVDRREPDKAVKIIRHLKGFEPKVAAQLERETGLLVGGSP